MDINNLVGSLSGLFQMQQGANIASAGFNLQANTIRQASEMQAQGQLMAATGFRQSAEAVRAATIFNSQVDSINAERQIASVARQYQRVLGQQLAQQANTGVAIGSKSFLMLQAETRDVYENGLLHLKLDIENTARAKKFESTMRQVELENQARTSEYQAAAERILGMNRAAEAAFQGEIAQFGARQQMVKAMPTLLSEAFGGYGG